MRHTSLLTMYGTCVIAFSFFDPNFFKNVRVCRCVWLATPKICTHNCLSHSHELEKKASSEKLMRGKRESRENENKMKVLDSRRKAGGELSSFETEPF